MTERIEEICQGHITHITARCKKCTKDDYNKQCQNYQPLYMVIFNIAEAVTCEDNFPESRFDEHGMYE